MKPVSFAPRAIGERDARQLVLRRPSLGVTDATGPTPATHADLTARKGFPVAIGQVLAELGFPGPASARDGWPSMAEPPSLPIPPSGRLSASPQATSTRSPRVAKGPQSEVLAADSF